ncbi:MAG: T9SS type A sorting domain-containing protein [Bacteroidales bacterium]
MNLPPLNEVGLIQIDPDNWVVNQSGAITTNVEEHDSPLNFTYSPNPVSDQLNLTFKSTSNIEREIGIYTLTGEEVRSVKSSSNIVDMDLADLPAAAYLIQVSDKFNKTSKKFIKLN